MIGGSTRVFAILGDPVGHSLSPAMHNAAFRALGLDATYVALRTPSGDLATAIRLLAGAGGGGNVTVPHKEAAATALTEPGPRVQALGAIRVIPISVFVKFDHPIPKFHFCNPRLRLTSTYLLGRCAMSTDPRMDGLLRHGCAIGVPVAAEP